MINYNRDDLYVLFSFIKDIANTDYWTKVEASDVEDEDDSEGYNKIARPLVGYKVKYKQRGEHFNDSNVVEYVFKFKSPDGIKTNYIVRMSYMAGWGLEDDASLTVQ